MWFIQLIPDSLLLFFIYSCMGAGIVGLILSFFLNFIPFIGKYKAAIQITSIFLLVVGLWTGGTLNAQEHWKEKVDRLKTELDDTKKRLTTAENNLQLEHKLKDRILKIAEAKASTQEKINKRSPEIDAECKVPKIAVDILNESASDIKFNEKKAKVQK